MKKVLACTLFGAFLLYPLWVLASSQHAGTTWAGALYGLGQVLALTGFILIFFQYVLSSRIKWIERGIGLDKLFRTHRNLGILGLALVFFHPLALLIFDITQVGGYAVSARKAIGALALLVVIAAGGVAILHARMRYETWKKIHRVAYVIFPLAFAHSVLLGSTVRMRPLVIFWYLLGALYAAAFVHRVVLWTRVRGRPHAITGVTQETHDTWTIRFEKKALRYQPGQFMIVRFHREGKVSEPHPFTISSSPTEDHLSITVKSVGDFTSTVGRTKTSDRAYIDAPYGVFSFLHHRDAGNLVFIAGGIGITPFMSMLRYMRDRRAGNSVVLLWGNKTERDIVFRGELESLQVSMPALKVVHVMSTQEGWQGEKGYIDGRIIAKYAGETRSARFFLCGPPIMMRNVERTLRSLGVPRRKIHYERFAL